MSARRLTRCGVCGWTSLTPILNLGTSPPPCVMHPVGSAPMVEEHYPLELVRCDGCGLVQLSVIVDPEVMFPLEFPYSSGNSRQLHRTFEQLASEVKVGSDDLVVDIGANDGTLLSKFDGCRTLGVEPTNQARRIEGPRIQAFFDEGVARYILDTYGPARVITACNVMAHVEDANEVMRGVQRLLAPGGVFIADNHDVNAVLAGQWDMVYHEHLRFYSPQTFETLLRRHGLGCASWHATDTHGGSFRMLATAAAHAAPPNTYPTPGSWTHYARRVRRVRASIRRKLSGWDRVWAIGATARGTTILNYCGLDVEDVQCVLEVSSSDKIGHYIPGTRIPVVDESRLFAAEAPPVVLLLSWHLEDIIVPKLRDRGYVGPILVPLPEPHYAEGATPCTPGPPAQTTAMTAAR